MEVTKEKAKVQVRVKARKVFEWCRVKKACGRFWDFVVRCADDWSLLDLSLQELCSQFPSVQCLSLAEQHIVLPSMYSITGSH